MHLDIADGIEGRLNIKCLVEQGRISKLRVHSTRPLQLPKVFHGRTRDEVLTMIPRIYASNPIAQSYAAVTAFESILKLSTRDRDMALRNLLVKIEILSEHLLRLFYDWPRILQEQPRAAEADWMQKKLAQLQQACDPRQEAFAFNMRTLKPDQETGLVILSEVQEALRQELFGMDPLAWAGLEPQQIKTWVERAAAPAAEMLQEIQGLGIALLGQGEVQGLPWLGLGELGADLRFKEAEEYAQQPSLNGQIHETTPLSRMWAQPKVQGLIKLFGDGLWMRILSRLLETCQCLSELKTELLDPKQSRLFGQSRSLAAQGVSQIEAARGKLIHRVALEGDRVKQYDILAPTDWNFHPRGILAKSLVGLPYEGDTSTRLKIELLVHALDPCVDYEIELESSA